MSFSLNDVGIAHKVASSPLALSIPTATSQEQSQSRSPLSPSTNASDISTLSSTHGPQSSRDLSSLLDSQNYFEISQEDIPDAFHVEPPNISTNEPLTTSLQRLDTFLQSGDYLLAALLAGLILWSGQVSPTDHRQIFSLISTRFACLSLYPSLRHIAAQESRTLFGDVNNEFWYNDHSLTTESDTSYIERPHWSAHIIPFDFRLQIVTLQTLTFADGGRPDGRRGISSLYELGLECRDRAFSRSSTSGEFATWRDRLWEIHMHIVNTLLEMDDFETARRTLQTTLAQIDGSLSHETRARLVLLLLRIGDVAPAKNLLESSPMEAPIAPLLPPLVSVANGDYSAAVSMLQDLLSKDQNSGWANVIKQNLAVCLLYSGQVNEAKATLQALVDSGQDFRSLTFNLATLYELSSEKSEALKLGLVEKVKGLNLADKTRGIEKVDFKL